MINKFFVVSLPRTGTTSLCMMGRLCGLRTKHAPVSSYESALERYDLLADTPIFCPSIISKLCLNTKFESKFIYIDKDFDAIFGSWNKVGLYRNYLNMRSCTNLSNSMSFDISSYNDAFNNMELNQTNYMDIFQKHKSTVSDIITKNNKELLIYNFDNGWYPFCSFIDKPAPDHKLPHLNIDTMFDKY